MGPKSRGGGGGFAVHHISADKVSAEPAWPKARGLPVKATLTHQQLVRSHGGRGGGRSAPSLRRNKAVSAPHKYAARVPNASPLRRMIAPVPAEKPPPRDREPLRVRSVVGRRGTGCRRAAAPTAVAPSPLGSARLRSHFSSRQNNTAVPYLMTLDFHFQRLLQARYVHVPPTKALWSDFGRG